MPRPRAEAIGEVRATLATLAGFGLFAPDAVDGIAARVSVLRESDAERALRDAAVIFEGVPEVLDLKREVFARVSKVAGPDPSSPRPPPPFWSMICHPRSSGRSVSSTRIGSIRHFSFRWWRFRPARAPIPP